MITRPLGNTGTTITAVGFGAWAIGGLGYGEQDEDAAFEAIDTYLERGGRFIDTARGYGVSEIMVGKRLKRFGAADDVFVASKSGSTHPPIVKTDLETSRFCLQRDVVDLYYIHVPPPDFDHLRRLLDAYQEAKDRGRIRFVGLSCRGLKTPEEIEVGLRYVEDGRIDVMQLEYSYAHPMAEPVITAAAERGIGIVTRLNLLKGFLTGRYTPGHRFPHRDNDGRAGIDPEKLDAVLGIVQALEANHMRPPFTTMTQMALAFPLVNPGVSAVIPGGRSRSQVDANMAINELPPMTAEQAKALVDAARGIRELF
jgi:myo-inositol catabolism protein IolS